MTRPPLVVRAEDGIIDKLKGAVGSVANKVKDTAGAIKDIVVGTGEDVKKSAQDTTENAKGKAEELRDKAKQSGEELKDNVKSTAESAKGKADEYGVSQPPPSPSLSNLRFIHNSTRPFHHLPSKHSLSIISSPLQEKAKGAAQDVGSSAQAKGEEAADSAKQAGQDLKGKAQDTGESAQAKGEEAADSAKKGIDQAGDSAKQVTKSFFPDEQ